MQNLNQEYVNKRYMHYIGKSSFYIKSKLFYTHITEKTEKLKTLTGCLYLAST